MEEEEEKEEEEDEEEEEEDYYCQKEITATVLWHQKSLSRAIMIGNIYINIAISIPIVIIDVPHQHH